ADLFRVQQYSKTYNESGDHRSVFYAESSLLVHYIYDNQLLLKLADYFAALHDQKKPVEQAIQQAFGMTPEQFDKILRNYLNSGRFRYYPIATPANIVPAQFIETSVSLADAHAVLADIDVHSLDHHDRALGEFQAVLQMDPNNASAMRGMGYSYLQRQEFDHAREYFRQAAERDSKDPRVHYYNALLMNRAGGFGREKSDEMKKELETAIALDPQLADAYSLLAYAQAFSGEPEKGLATMEKAVELSPRNESYQFNLANIYMANRKVDEAIALLRGLAVSGKPEVASHANAELAQAEDFKARTKSFQAQIESRASDNVERARDSASIPAGKAEAEMHPTPVLFVKGKLTAVDCSATPQALLSVSSGGRSLKLHVGDRKHVVLIGADEFSCDWKNKNVALNYRGRQD